MKLVLDLGRNLGLQGLCALVLAGNCLPVVAQLRSEQPSSSASSLSTTTTTTNRPSILLADEPRGALDSHTAEDTMHLFNELVLHGITVIVVTHDQDTADHARRIVRMRDGQIVDDSGATNSGNANSDSKNIAAG